MSSFKSFLSGNKPLVWMLLLVVIPMLMHAAVGWSYLSWPLEQVEKLLGDYNPLLNAPDDHRESWPWALAVLACWVAVAAYAWRRFTRGSSR